MLATVDDLRRELVSAYDKVLARPLDWAIFTADERHALAAAQAEVAANDAVAQAVLQVAQRYQARESEEAMKEPKFLTAQNKALLSAGGIDWQKILQLGAKGLQALLFLIQLFGGGVPQPAQGKSQPECDHHACACDCFKAAVNTAAVCADHCCHCCETYC